LGASDLVERLAGGGNHVEGVKADLGAGQRPANRSLIPWTHVDRDRPNRFFAVAEQVKELLQGLA
jgi:hypothetical protein